ncbi:MAG TPA: mannose-6-phosphate isomerase [Trebonia sp.]|jgi:mannose-6-phosphate isomerase
MNAPIVLEPNQPAHFYRGGAGIARFRDIPQPSANSPEDWLASTTSIFSRPGVGLTRLPNGETLRDAIAADPDGYLGPDHVARYGTDPALLTKMLDTGQRLVVHFHPDRDFAARHLNSRHGKTEAWIILETRDEDGDPSAGHVYLGFARDTDPGVVRRWVDDQDTAAILDSLNKVAVAPGDTILVPAGVPHAIGAGITLIELQEPTDFSILLEWAGFAIDGSREGHLGLGFDLALTALDYGGWDAGRLSALRSLRPDAVSRAGVTRLLPTRADPFFRAERVDVSVPVTFSPGYAVVVVVSGHGAITYPAGTLAVRRGTSLLVPFGAGATTFDGEFQALRCCPPS